MKKILRLGQITLLSSLLLLGTQNLMGNDCSTKLFSATMDSKLSIGDVVENLADTCGLTVIVKDEAARQRMMKKLYYVKLKNSTLKGFLNTVLTDNDLHYTLRGNKLKISYLITRTFRIHYIAGQRIGKSNAHVTIANSNNSASNGTSNDGSTASKTGISIESNDEFIFWKTVENEVQRILIGAADGSTHYTRKGDTWEGPDGKVWEYNPLAPIVNAEAGMITVTGTDRQIARVSQYITTLTKQIKSQVMIDVRILTVTFNDSKTTGVDWSQLYTLQNMTIDTLRMAEKNINKMTFDSLEGIQEYEWIKGEYDQDPRANGSISMVQAKGHSKVSEIVKFLSTQGDVKSISSPRVMTLSNQPALISVGKELFYKIKSSNTSSSGGGSTSSQGELVDSVFAGILLDITPEIDGNGMITLKINPSISETVNNVPSDGTTRDIPPDLVRRQIASVIKVQDGEHAILGGLISSKSGIRVNKVPLLGDIPFLEYAFKHEEKIDTIEELVLIITPHIVKNAKSLSLKDLGYTKLNEK